MSVCWDKDPSKRPSFEHVHNSLCQIFKEHAGTYTGDELKQQGKELLKEMPELKRVSYIKWRKGGGKILQKLCILLKDNTIPLNDLDITCKYI